MVRVALIGCGAVAEGGHLPTLLRHRRFTVAATCDTRLERAQLLARRAGDVPAYADWRELLAGQPVDAAVLAMPPEHSPAVAVGCLQRGLAVLDEKPLAAKLDDGQRVARAVKETRGVYQVGFVLRYGDWVREIGRLARAIGSPARMRIAVYDERLGQSAAHLERMQSFLRDSSAMTHEGSHVIDYASLWNPAPWTRLRATAVRTAPEFAGPNFWEAAIDLADGSTLEVEVGWLLEKLPPGSVAIEGPNGQLHFDLSTGAGRWQIAGREAVLSLPPLAPEWKRQYDAFASAIEVGAATVATVDDGLRALEITAACEASARFAAVVHRTPQTTLETVL